MALVSVRYIPIKIKPLWPTNIPGSNIGERDQRAQPEPLFYHCLSQLP